MKHVTFNCTLLRDGHQSLAATRMSTEQMFGIASMLDSMGFSALETWGGATISAGLRFFREHPFERLDTLKMLAPNTPHMMLLRGQNLVGSTHYMVGNTHYADDVVTAFCTLAAKHGMNVFRICDSLNDPENMRTAIQAVKAAGKTAHGAIYYTASPVHTPEYFAGLGRRIADMGADGIVIKDSTGLMPPRAAAALTAALKKATGLPVCIHTHDTVGLGAAAYLAGIMAGADAVDVSIAPFADGTGQPDAARMLSLLNGNARCPVVAADFMETLTMMSAMLRPIYESLSEFTDPKNKMVNKEMLRYQLPGSILSNLRSQLKDLNMTDMFEEVLAEIPVVRKALGWSPLVTPISQIVGVQAMMNVRYGRWTNIAPQCADVVLGYYGHTPAPVDPELQALCAKRQGKAPITCRPADLIKPGMQDLRDKLAAKGLPVTDENCVIYAMFPQLLETYYADGGRYSANYAASVVLSSAEETEEPAEDEEEYDEEEYDEEEYDEEEYDEEECDEEEYDEEECDEEECDEEECDEEECDEEECDEEEYDEEEYDEEEYDEEDGIGVEEDKAEAIKWYRKAAEQGNAEAQYQLGECYYHGIGVELDNEQAVEWYRKAAEQGNAEAQYQLGDCYYYGIGVEEDEAEAVKWFRKAAEQGNAEAQYKLGICYWIGQGVEQDKEQAVEWYRKAAEQGNDEAQSELDCCCENGRGVEEECDEEEYDEEEYDEEDEAAEQGHIGTQNSLGQLRQRAETAQPVSPGDDSAQTLDEELDALLAELSTGDSPA